MAVKLRDYKCSPYSSNKVHVEVMLYDVIVSIFWGIGLIVQCSMGRKQPVNALWDGIEFCYVTVIHVSYC